MIIKIKNRRGEIIDHDDREIVPDGHGIVVSSFLMDGVQTEIAHSRVTDAPMLTDSLGREAGHRPGFVYDGGNETQARQAHSQMCRRNESAWRSAGATISDSNPGWPGAWEGPSRYGKPSDVRLASSEAREQYRIWLSEQWKSPGAPAYQGYQQGGWTDRCPKELPADVKMGDAQQIRDAAHRDLIRRTENAWKTPTGVP